MTSETFINGLSVITIENSYLAVSIIPALGGKIWSIYNKELQKEFLWHNKKLPLQVQPRGADYDANFLGAVDELLPNDLAETIDGIDYPDHGELWTTHLQHTITEDSITVHALLALSGLHYTKTLRLHPDSPTLQADYSIKNTTRELRHFLWKLHAALVIAPGYKLVTPAKWGQVVDTDYSRFGDTTPFTWPVVAGVDASVVPPQGTEVDFFYLYNTPNGEMALVSSDTQHVFRYLYDTKVFPYQWYFASYGGFLDHYMAILEPCTNMPMSVVEAKEQGQSAKLGPGETLTTTVHIYAGNNK